MLRLLLARNSLTTNICIFTVEGGETSPVRYRHVEGDKRLMVRTHYDNLKVARTAPDEVIRAAYRTLAQKYHPDINPDPNAAQIMKVLNAAYAVLADPEKRRAHDEWIVEQERHEREPPRRDPPREEPRQQERAYTAPHQPPSQPSVAKRVLSHVLQHAFAYFFVGIVTVAWLGDFKSSPPPGPKPYQAEPPYPIPSAPVAPTVASWHRPATAPNGVAWPTNAGYISGFKRHNTNGRSKVTVDNTGNDSDVFVKLVSLDSEKAYPARIFYIPSRGSFTVGRLSPGTYDVRYRDLDSGHLSRSEQFTLTEEEVDGGLQYSNMTLTLFKVLNGNMQTYGLAEDEF